MYHGIHSTAPAHGLKGTSSQQQEAVFVPALQVTLLSATCHLQATKQSYALRSYRFPAVQSSVVFYALHCRERVAATPRLFPAR